MVNVTNIAIPIHAFMVPPILNETRRSPFVQQTFAEALLAPTGNDNTTFSPV